MSTLAELCATYGADGLAFSAKASLVLLLALIAGRVSRGGSASERHLIYFTALTLGAALPILSVVGPKLALLRAPTAVDPVHVTESSALVSAPDVAGSFLSAFFFAWCVGLVFFSTRRIAEWIQLRRFQRTAQVVDSKVWRAVLDNLRDEMGIEKRVRLLSHPDAETSATWGVLQPVILLARDANAWSPDRRRAILMHELGHIRRHDVLTQRIAAIACALYWFNPLAWMVAARMRSERENACDDLVLSAGAKPSRYAACLFDMYRRLVSVPEPVQAAAACGLPRPGTGKPEMERRLESLLDTSRRHERLNVKHSILTLTLLVGFALPLAALELTGESKTQDLEQKREDRLRELREKNTRKTGGVRVGKTRPQPEAKPAPKQDGGAKPAKANDRKVVRKVDVSSSTSSNDGSGEKKGSDPELERKLEKRMDEIMRKMRNGASAKDVEKDLERMMEETLRDMRGRMDRDLAKNRKVVTDSDSDSDEQTVTSKDGKARATAKASATATSSSSSSSSSSDSAKSSDSSSSKDSSSGKKKAGKRTPAKKKLGKRD